MPVSNLASLSEFKWTEEYMDKCYICGKEDETVKERICGYHQDIDGEEVWETICDDCEDEHRLAI